MREKRLSPSYFVAIVGFVHVKRDRRWSVDRHGEIAFLRFSIGRGFRDEELTQFT